MEMAPIITTDEVLVEFLANFSGYGRLARDGAIHRRAKESVPGKVDPGHGGTV